MTIAALDNREAATSQPRSFTRVRAELAESALAGIIRACGHGQRATGRVPSLSLHRAPTAGEIAAWNDALAEVADLFALIAAAGAGLAGRARQPTQAPR